jgi:hypothetical protein
VVNKINNNNKNDLIYNPITYANTQENDDKYNNYTLETINNNKYEVIYTDNVKNRETDTYIDAEELYKRLKIDENNIGLVVDAAAVSVLSILTNGSPVMDSNNTNRKKVYYIYGPEVVNDPASKTPVDSKELTKNGYSFDTGVEIIPCVSINPSSFKYDYSFSSPSDSDSNSNFDTQNTLYLEQFFTKYNFNLSEINIDTKGKGMNMYSTSLNVTDNTNQNLEPISDTNSRESNKKDNAKAEIQDVYEAFTGTQKIIAAYDATDTKLKTKSYQYVAYIGSSSDTITSSVL